MMFFACAISSLITAGLTGYTLRRVCNARVCQLKSQLLIAFDEVSASRQHGTDLETQLAEYKNESSRLQPACLPVDHTTTDSELDHPQQCVVGFTKHEPIGANELIASQSSDWCLQIETAIEETDIAITEAIEGFMRIAERSVQTADEAKDAVNGADNATLTALASDAEEVIKKFLIDSRENASQLNQMNSYIAETLTISQKMYELLDKLERIHMQTNLLSLNASVEAARSRDQNGGFGVVAQELRKLSSRSEDAAKDLRRLTSDLDKHSHLVHDGLKQIAEDSLANSSVAQSEATTILQDITNVDARTTASVDRLSKLAQSVGRDIGHVVTVLQFQDLLRQRLEHVAGPLRKISEQAKNVGTVIAEVNIVNSNPVRLPGMAPELKLVKYERDYNEQDNITLF